MLLCNFPKTIHISYDKKKKFLIASFCCWTQPACHHGPRHCFHWCPRCLCLLLRLCQARGSYHSQNNVNQTQNPNSIFLVSLPANWWCPYFCIPRVPLRFKQKKSGCVCVCVCVMMDRTMGCRTGWRNRCPHTAFWVGQSSDQHSNPQNRN